MYRRGVTSVPPSRNLVSSFGHEILETIPSSRQQYSYVYLPGSFSNWCEPRAEHTPTRRPLTAGGHTRRGPLAGAGGLIKSNTYIERSTVGRQNTAEIPILASSTFDSPLSITSSKILVIATKNTAETQTRSNSSDRNKGLQSSSDDCQEHHKNEQRKNIPGNLHQELTKLWHSSIKQIEPYN